MDRFLACVNLVSFYKSFVCLLCKRNILQDCPFILLKNILLSFCAMGKRALRRRYTSFHYFLKRGLMRNEYLILLSVYDYLYESLQYYVHFILNKDGIFYA